MKCVEVSCTEVTAVLVTGAAQQLSNKLQNFNIYVTRSIYIELKVPEHQKYYLLNKRVLVDYRASLL